MESKRELELQFLIAAKEGNMPELDRCLEADVDLECRATESELQEYQSGSTSQSGSVNVNTLPEKM